MPDWAAWPFPTEDPYPVYHAARAQAAVQWNEQLGAHLVLSHDHATAVLRGPEWSSDPRNSPQLLASLGGGPGPELWGRSLLMSDPPTHTRLRSAVNRFFTPRAVQRIRERVAAIVDSAFAPLAEGEPVELMSELAYPIPLAVIAELFDVGLEGAELLGSETPTLARMLELDPTPDELKAISTAAMTVMLFLVPIVAQRRVDPGEDLLSALIHPPAGGVTLETDEIITMCLLLLAAGHETTANLIGNGTLALFEHPEEFELACSASRPLRSSCRGAPALRQPRPGCLARRSGRSYARRSQCAQGPAGACGAWRGQPRSRAPPRPRPSGPDTQRIASPCFRQRPALLRRRRSCPIGGAGDVHPPRAIRFDTDSRWLVVFPGSLSHLQEAAEPAHRRQPASPFTAHP